MQNVLFKGCSRCSGDTYQVHDLDGDYRKCLQCGRIEWKADADVFAQAA